MKRWTVLLMVVCITPCLSGCTWFQKVHPLRVVNPGLLREDLILCVTNGADVEMQRPRIEKTGMLVDDKEVAVQPTIQSSRRPQGWCESAEFPAPRGAKTATLQATVSNGGLKFTVLQLWEYRENAGYLGQPAWVLRLATVDPVK